MSDVGGLIQHVIRAGGQRGAHDGHSRRCRSPSRSARLAVVERANPRDQLHAVHALESIPHEHRVVVGAATEVFTRALAVAVPGHVPFVAGEDLGEHVRDAFVAVRDEDRLHEARTTRAEDRAPKSCEPSSLPCSSGASPAMPSPSSRGACAGTAGSAGIGRRARRRTTRRPSRGRSGRAALVHGQRMRTRALGFPVPPLGTPDAARPHEGTTVAIAA